MSNDANQPGPEATIHLNPRAPQRGGGNGGGNSQSSSSSASVSQSQSLSQSQSVSSSSSIAIPSTAPAGGLTITQPPQTATSFYKIAPSQPITFAWNFTYLLATPSSLTISAVGDNSNTYPVGPTNGIIAGSATSVVWDPYAYNQNAGSQPTLGMGTYTLKIWGDQGPDAARAPGYLQPNTALKFALYTPQPYTPIASGWQCTTCNSALSMLSFHPAFLGIMVTFAVMFLSGWGILSRGR